MGRPKRPSDELPQIRARFHVHRLAWRLRKRLSNDGVAGFGIHRNAKRAYDRVPGAHQAHRQPRALIGVPDCALAPAGTVGHRVRKGSHHDGESTCTLHLPSRALRGARRTGDGTRATGVCCGQPRQLIHWGRVRARRRHRTDGRVVSSPRDQPRRHRSGTFRVPGSCWACECCPCCDSSWTIWTSARSAAHPDRSLAVRSARRSRRRVKRPSPSSICRYR